jgi:hypothetical protein
MAGGYGSLRSQGRRIAWCIRPASDSNFKQPTNTPPPSRGATRPSCAGIIRPKIEGVGNAGCPPHPQPRVQSVGSTRGSRHRSTGTPGIPARNGFNGFLRALPGDRACLPPSPTDIGVSGPIGPTSPSANLTPASGRQDHTTSPSAVSALVRSAARVHRIPPRVRDDRDTPLKWDETAGM